MKQYELAKKAGLNPSYLNTVIRRWRKPSWDTAKKLAAITETDPALWMDGTEEEIRRAIEQ